MFPENYLHEIDARNIPDYDLHDFIFLLSNATSIISAKCEYHWIRFKEVNEHGILLENAIHTESGWNDPLSPEIIFLELKTEFEKMTEIKIGRSWIDPESPVFELTIEFFLPSFNLKKAYDIVNEFLIDVEKKVYKRIIKMAIDNL